MLPMQHTMRSSISTHTSGRISSKTLHISSPWMFVHFKMGEPPPIAAYWSAIFGVRFFATHGPTSFCILPIGMISGSVNRFVRKSCTSGSVDGPPMFIMAIAVGAFLVAFFIAVVAIVVGKKEGRRVLRE